MDRLVEESKIVLVSAKETIRHEYDEKGNHRIKRYTAEKGPEASDWVWYQGVARLGELAATSAYYDGVLPRIFRVVEL